jgi:GntR family transcriptional regulator/MocR family aminotransferase
VAEFIAAGHLTRHVRKMREVYKLRRQLLLESLHDRLGGWLEAIPSFYGMHVAATLTAAVDLENVADELLRHNVKIHALSRYFLGPQTRAGLVFGYGTVDLPDIRRGVSVLHRVLQRQAG